MTYDLKMLLSSTQKIKSSKKFKKVFVDSTDEIGSIAGNFNHLIDRLNKSFEATTEQKNLFETVINSMEEGVLCVSNEGDVLLFNKAILNHLKEDFNPEGKKLLEATRIHSFYELFTDCLDSGLIEKEFTLQKQGLKKTFFAWAKSTPDNHAVVIVLHDKTQIRSLETIRQDFVANVSHELRTPVSVIMANSETLLDGGSDDYKIRNNFLKAIHKNSLRLSNLISDLLDLSRLDSGKVDLNPSNVFLRQEVNNILLMFRNKIIKNNISLAVELPENSIILADPKAFEQILINFLDNALKYSPKGGSIKIYCKNADSYWRVFIEDNGPGIDNTMKGFSNVFIELTQAGLENWVVLA